MNHPDLDLVPADPLGGVDYGPCDDPAPDTLGEDPRVCTTCFYSVLDHFPKRKLYRVSLHREWIVSAPTSYNEDSVFRGAATEFLNTDLSDLIDVELYEAGPVWPDLVLEEEV